MIFLSLIVLAESIIIYDNDQISSAQPEDKKIINTSIVEETITEILSPVPIEILYPKPTYTPTLRSYEIDKSDDIWHAKDPSSYIQPNNEWIQYYAKNNLSVGTIYRTDDDIYNYPPNGDMWQNADYTLVSGYGDCEDIAIAEVSIDIAKGYKAVVVGGYVTLDNGQRIRDFWEEIYTDNIKSIKSTNPALETQKRLRLEPLYMFNDKISWRVYDENWY